MRKLNDKDKTTLYMNMDRYLERRNHIDCFVPVEYSQIDEYTFNIMHYIFGAMQEGYEIHMCMNEHLNNMFFLDVSKFDDWNKKHQYTHTFMLDDYKDSEPNLVRDICESIERGMKEINQSILKEREKRSNV